jgi:hypothetical protein
MIVLREIEDNAWPFVISVIPPEPSEAFFERFFAKHRELLARKEPWVHLCDIRKVTKLPDARIRTMLAEESRKLDPLTARYTLGAATVIESALVRGILTAIYWINPPAAPSVVVATPHEGVEFLRTRLIKADVHVPTRMGADLVDLVAGRLDARAAPRAAP